MKLIFCVTLSLILSKFKVDADAVDLVKSLEKANADDYKMKFNDLILDCKFLILERVEFGDLLNVAQINDEFWKLAANVFRRKHSHLHIYIGGGFPLPVSPQELLNVAGMEIDSDTIEQVNRKTDLFLLCTYHPPLLRGNQLQLQTGDQVLNTFKYFGHDIKKLMAAIFEEDRPMQAEFVGRLINKYSSESLTDVFIEQNSEIMMKHIKVPLVNVENVSILRSHQNNDPHCIRLNESFPSMRRLRLIHLTEESLVHIDHHMPQLEHVSMAISGNALGTPHLPQFLAKNPQIRSIELKSPRSEYLFHVSIDIPQLIELVIENMYQALDGNVQFGNVTNFTIRQGQFASPANLKFPRLKTLNIFYENRILDNYLTFLNHHNHLTNLNIEYWNMNDAQFQQLAENLPNLVELNLNLHPNVSQPLSIAVILEFLRSHPNVMQLNVINFPENHKVELREQLKHEWKIRIDDAKMSFERI